MVGINTWNKLKPAEQEEYGSYHKKFVEAVCADPKALDYEIYQDNNHFFFIAQLETAPPYGGIKSKNRAVIETLLADAWQNYNR
jgi:L-rhamnose mutarotase